MMSYSRLRVDYLAIHNTSEVCLGCAPSYLRVQTLWDTACFRLIYAMWNTIHLPGAERSPAFDRRIHSGPGLGLVLVLYARTVLLYCIIFSQRQIKILRRPAIPPHLFGPHYHYLDLYLLSQTVGLCYESSTSYSINTVDLKPPYSNLTTNHPT